MKGKKAIILVVFITLLIATYVNASGAMYKGYPVVNIKLNGEHVTVTTGVPPINMDGRVLVPIRLAAEALDADIRWDQGTQTVLILKENRKVEEENNEEMPSLKGIKISDVSFNPYGTMCTGKITNENTMRVNVKYTIHFYKQGEYLGHLHGEEKFLHAGETVEFNIESEKAFRDYSNYKYTIDSVTKV